MAGYGGSQGLSGTGVANQVTFFDGVSSVAGSPNLTFVAATGKLYIGGLGAYIQGNPASGQLFIVAGDAAGDELYLTASDHASGGAIYFRNIGGSNRHRIEAGGEFGIGPQSTGSSYIAYYTSNAFTTLRGILGFSGAADAIVAGSVAGDAVFRVTAGGILFSVDAGLTVKAKISSAGLCTLGTGTSGVQLTVTTTQAGTPMVARFGNGTADAGAALELYSEYNPGENGGLLITTVDSSNKPYVTLGTSDSLGVMNNPCIEFNRASLLTIFKANATERLRVDTSGCITTGRQQVTGEAEIDGALNHDGTTVGLYGTAPVAQAAAKTNLTDSTGGTVDGTLVDVTTAALADPVKINNNFADCSDRINKALTVLRDLGALAA
jgi:hypothetical protein